MIAFSIGLTHYTIAQSDSIVLSKDGFRRVLLERNDLHECQKLYENNSKMMRLMEMRIGFKESQIENYQSIVSAQKKDIKGLKKMILKKNAIIYAEAVVSGYLAFKLIFR